ncbi:MAG TPA: penicillin-binding protein 2 [Gemmatimonadaceae bacterium]|nr:penicillin-binding protein 2 [Gemmatimonadaceae bacterium]
MSFHPNEIQRRARMASYLIAGAMGALVMAFFRTQVFQNDQYVLKSEENRLREVPLPAPRGIIYDRRGEIIAENVPGYSVSILSPSVDSLRAALRRLNGTIELTPDDMEVVVRRYRRAPTRPTVVRADASFDEVSVLEEHRVDFPGLIIQAAPKRYYPEGPVVAAFVGYTGEITEAELASAKYQGYKAGQQIGKDGLEKQYEEVLRGTEGTRFVEVDAHGRVVREAGARQDLMPVGADSLRTNIDLDLQRFIARLFGDSLQGGLVALDPRDGAVLALHSAPTFDPNRFIGGIPAAYWRELNTDRRRPLYNKAIKGRYPPASTFKLATAAIGLQRGAVRMTDHMPQPCTGGYQYGTRYFRCWKREGHGDIDLGRAIEVSCDVYFYQLGLKIGLRDLIAGGRSQAFMERTGIDLPDESRPRFPDSERYYDARYGPRGWTRAVTLNLAIGQGENAQTVANMARFYTALATSGEAVRPEIVSRRPEKTRLFRLTDTQMEGMRAALAGVVSRGTAASAALEGALLAGKTGTAQNSEDAKNDHAWFVGFAPADDPKIVVAVMLEFGGHGDRAARFASKVIDFYLKTTTTQMLNTEG